MPTNQEARQLATRHHAIITPYRQFEGNCDGTVSWWLRARLQGKEIWRDKYFDRIYNLEAYPEEAFGRPVAVDHHDATGIHTDRGLAKSRALQNLFYGTDASRAYITDGIRDDKSRAPKPVARFVEAQASQSISDVATRDDNANNICRSFERSALGRRASKYSVKSTEAHALGLDCTESPRIRYFDPNIGEFIFPNVSELTTWWRTCYQTRNTGGGAFGIMQFMFNADHFEKL